MQAMLGGTLNTGSIQQMLTNICCRLEMTGNRFLPREAAMLARSWDRNSVRPSVRHTRAL